MLLLLRPTTCCRSDTAHLKSTFILPVVFFSADAAVKGAAAVEANSVLLVGLLDDADHCGAAAADDDDDDV
jgi:hypothetical protein